MVNKGCEPSSPANIQNLTQNVVVFLKKKNSEVTEEGNVKMNINLVGQSKNNNKMQLTSTQRDKKSEANCSCPTWHTDGNNNNCNNNRNHNNNSN